MTIPFDQQVTEMTPSLRAFAFSRTRHRQDAEDLTQDTVTRALSCQEQFQAGSNLKAWIFTIMRNLHIDMVRRCKREAVTDMDESDIRDLRVIGPSQFNRLLLGELAVAMDRLLDSQREALMLVVVNGLSYEEAAVVCQCPVGTIRSRIARGRAFLENAMLGKVRSKGAATRPEHQAVV